MQHQKWAVVTAGMLFLITPIVAAQTTSETATGVQADSGDAFVLVNGTRLHYVDWGGHGEVLLFLTGGGASAHSFDAYAPMFTDRFHVLGLTRRGQAPSDKPSGGYDLPTRTEDIRALLNHKQFSRVNIVGFSIAGDEMTHFAGTYPERVSRLVYLDAAYDRQSNWELNQKSPFPRTKPADAAAAAIIEASRVVRPDYSKVLAPALSFYAVPGAVPLRANSDPAMRAAGEVFWKAFQEWIRQQMQQFREGVRNGNVVELTATTHGDVLHRSETRDEIIRAMRLFLLTP